MLAGLFIGSIKHFCLHSILTFSKSCPDKLKALNQPQSATEESFFTRDIT